MCITTAIRTPPRLSVIADVQRSNVTLYSRKYAEATPPDSYLINWFDLHVAVSGYDYVLDIWVSRVANGRQYRAYADENFWNTKVEIQQYQLLTSISRTVFEYVYAKQSLSSAGVIERKGMQHNYVLCILYYHRRKNGAI